jgi:AraC-like DNA-binding protein/ligand-binding sensor protein
MSNDSGSRLDRHGEKLERLYSLIGIIYKVTGLQGIVVNLIDWTVHDLPSGWVKKCFCKQLLNAAQSDLTEPFVQAINSMTRPHDQFVYRCPFQLANIVTPVLVDEQPIALLIIGPILNSDPVELISTVVLPSGPYTYMELNRLRAQLETLPEGDDEYISAVSELILLLLESEQTSGNVATSEGQQANRASQGASQDAPQGVCANELGSSCVSTIDIALEYINKNFASEISLATVAESAFVHPTHLSKIFSRRMNMRFRDYINHLRVKEAKRLLRESSMLIADISSEVGFSDQSYFDKIFKQLEGLTPNQYRRQEKTVARTDVPFP